MKQPSQARKGTNTRALLEVIRDNSLGPIWQDKGLTLSWVAEVVLTQAGFTDAEIASLFGGKATPKVVRVDPVAAGQRPARRLEELAKPVHHRSLLPALVALGKDHHAVGRGEFTLSNLQH